MELEYMLLAIIFGIAFFPATFKALRDTVLPELCAWWRAPHCSCCKRKKRPRKVVPAVAQRGRARFVQPAKVTNELTEQAGAVGRKNDSSARKAQQYDHTKRPAKFQFSSAAESHAQQARLEAKMAAEHNYLFHYTSRSRTSKKAKQHFDKLDQKEAAAAKRTADKAAAEETAGLFRKARPLPKRPQTPQDKREEQQQQARDFLHTQGAVDAGRITQDELDAWNSRARF
jgi:hypothetical protein